MANKSTCYRPLDAAVKEIRILHLNTSSKDPSGRLECHHEHMSLASYPGTAYRAISWYWGDVSRRKEILLNGEVVEVPQNADEVLRRLCFDHGHSCVWLDAVCINMEDTVEQGKQVAIMDDIYESAEQVLVWLGEEEESTEAALESIHDIVQQCKEVIMGDEASTENTNDWIYSQLLSAMPNHAYDIDQFTEPLPLENWEALNEFFTSPWFSRLWVVQEVSLSKHAVCYRGSYSILWDDIGVLVIWLAVRGYKEYIESEPADGFHQAANIFLTGIAIFQRTTSRGFQEISLGYLLDMSLSAESSQPLDKVYALIGLLKRYPPGQEVVRDIPVDYQAPLEKVYTIATRRFLEEDLKTDPDYPQILDIIAFAPILESKSSTSHLSNCMPTWVPRWDCKFRRSGEHHRLQVYWTAHGSTRAQIQPAPAADPVLRIRGVPLGCISQRGEAITEEVLADQMSLRSVILNTTSLISELGMSELEIASLITGGDNGDCKKAVEDPEFSQLFCSCLEWVECPSDTDAPLFLNILHVVEHQRYFTTSNGRAGVGPVDIRENDEVVILFGGRYPFILRQEGEYRRLLGTAYVHSVMEGEYIRQLEDEGRLDAQSKWFAIC